MPSCTNEHCPLKNTITAIDLVEPKLFPFQGKNLESMACVRYLTSAVIGTEFEMR